VDNGRTQFSSSWPRWTNPSLFIVAKMDKPNSLHRGQVDLQCCILFSSYHHDSVVRPYHWWWWWWWWSDGRCDTPFFHWVIERKVLTINVTFFTAFSSVKSARISNDLLTWNYI
jgi:hypothetical protein